MGRRVAGYRLVERPEKGGREDGGPDMNAFPSLKMGAKHKVSAMNLIQAATSRP